MKMKKKQVEKLDEEAAEDEEEGAALREDLELPLRLLSGWGQAGKKSADPSAPKGVGASGGSLFLRLFLRLFVCLFVCLFACLLVCLLVVWA